MWHNWYFNLKNHRCFSDVNSRMLVLKAKLPMHSVLSYLAFQLSTERKCCGSIFIIKARTHRPLVLKMLGDSSLEINNAF